MARPTADTFTTYNFIAQLKANNVKSVINLQTPGEHKYCGPPLMDSGFTYDPEILMRNEIFFYNFVWPDFGAVGIDALFDVVKVIHFGIDQGNVAVHCHAGLGRTGVVIASYLVWMHHMSAEEAITLVRVKRPNSVQSAEQVNVVKVFWKFLVEEARAIPQQKKRNFFNYLELQDRVLSNKESRNFKHIPKVAYLLCDILLHCVFSVTDEEKEYGTKRFAKIPKHYKSHCALKSQEWAGYWMMQRKISPQEFIKKLEELLQGFRNEGSQVEVEQCIANGYFNMTDTQTFADKELKGKTDLTLRVLHRFITSLEKPIVSAAELSKAFEKYDSKPIQAWQCFFYYLTNVMSLLCGSTGDSPVAARLIVLWYTGATSDQLENLVHSYMKNCAQYGL